MALPQAKLFKFYVTQSDDLQIAISDFLSTLPDKTVVQITCTDCIQNGGAALLVIISWNA